MNDPVKNFAFDFAYRRVTRMFTTELAFNFASSRQPLLALCSIVHHIFQTMNITIYQQIQILWPLSEATIPRNSEVFAFIILLLEDEVRKLLTKSFTSSFSTPK